MAVLMQTEVNEVAESKPGRSWLFVNDRNCRWVSAERILGLSQLILTLGTTSLNHGLGESSSENQSAVALRLPRSLFRVWMTHSDRVSSALVILSRTQGHTLEMNAGLGMVLGKILQGTPGVPIPLCCFSAAY